MPVTATCTHCGKSFQVSSKFAGKKAKCTGCGNPFTIPGPAPVAAAKADLFENDLMAGLADAATDEARPAPVAAAPASRVAAPPRGVKPQRAPSSACPSCKAAIPPAAVLCVNCGFDLRLGKATVIEMDRPSAHAAPGRYTSAAAPRNTRGMRPNDGYTNPGVAMIDGWIPKLAVGTYVLLVVAYIIFGWIGFFHVAGAGGTGNNVSRLLVATVAIMFFAALYYFVVMGAASLGMRLVGGLLRFEMPENLMSRCLAVYYVGALTWVIVFSVGMALQSTGRSVSGMSETEAMHFIFGSLGTLVVACLFAVAAQFPAVWFVFRLKFLEAIIADLGYSIFGFVGLLGFGGIMVVIFWIIGSIAGGHASAR